jgi:mycofactocin precursor
VYSVTDIRHSSRFLARGGPMGSTEQTTNATDESIIVEDTLVEEISIDGMCGVY